MGGGIDPPLSVIAKWPASSKDPILRSKADWIICVIFMVLTNVVVLMRLWARSMIQRRMDLDDYAIIGALIFTLGMSITICLAFTQYHYDRHVWDAFIDPPLLVKGRQAVWAIEALNLMGTGLTKISILLFIRRLTSRNSTTAIVYTIWSTVVFVGLTTVVFELTLFLECRPLTAFWNRVDIRYVLGENEFHCVNEGAKLVSAGAISTLQDFMVTTIPLILLWNLRMERAKKAGVIAVFALGYLTCAVGIVRTVYTHVVYFKTYDTTWVGPTLLIWTTIELHLGIICACAPALKTFFTHYNILSLGSKFTSSLGMKYGSSSSKLTYEERSAKSGYDGKGLYTQELSKIDGEDVMESRC